MFQVVAHNAAEAAHAVRFCENDALLVETVRGLIAGSLEKGMRVVILSTFPRRREIEQSLASLGVDVAAARSQNRYVDADAARILSGLLVNSQPERARFNTVLGGLVTDIPPECRGVWVFSEVVALLWAQGMRDAALRLEAMLYDLARMRGFPLYCAYPLQGLSRHAPESNLPRFRAQDSRLVPLAFARSAYGPRAIDSLRRTAPPRGEPAQQACDTGDGARTCCRPGLDGATFRANRAEPGLLDYEPDEY